MRQASNDLVRRDKGSTLVPIFLPVTTYDAKASTFFEQQNANACAPMSRQLFTDVDDNNDTNSWLCS